jgi:hypothetical protein
MEFSEISYGSGTPTDKSRAEQQEQEIIIKEQLFQRLGKKINKPIDL